MENPLGNRNAESSLFMARHCPFHYLPVIIDFYLHTFCRRLFTLHNEFILTNDFVMAIYAYFNSLGWQLCADPVALLLGIIGIFQKNTGKTFAVIGVLGEVLTLLCILIQLFNLGILDHHGLMS